MITETERFSDIPMVKETTIKDDGRYLYYYSFPATEGKTERASDASALKTERKDV